MPEYRHAWEWGSEMILWTYQYETDVVVGSKAIPFCPLTTNVFSVAKYGKKFVDRRFYVWN
jgi:hypothetical protein